MKPIVRWTATFGIAASLIGIVGLAPTFADDWRHDGDRGDVRRDIRDIRRDEQRLHDLQCDRDREARRHDWDDVRRLDRQIRDLHEHIERDRRDVRHDSHDR
ncbi:MAG TPA: hypothetical protein VKU00_18320 [Chthonomonadaceae bacterium]|nr:hypothetical protein [Chthonomonadaceae bacterium]